jgi:hypothetical protein
MIGRDLEGEIVHDHFTDIVLETEETHEKPHNSRLRSEAYSSLRQALSVNTALTCLVSILLFSQPVNDMNTTHGHHGAESFLTG